MSQKKDLAQLADLAQLQYEAEIAVTTAEEALKEAKRRLVKIAEGQVPELMDKLGLEDFKTTSGLKVKVVENIRASVTKDRRPTAFKWLRDHGHGKLIKNKITLVPTDAEANSLRKVLKGQDYSEEPTVHANTLSAFVRDQLERGEDIPLDIFGVFRQRVSKIEIAS